MHKIFADDMQTIGENDKNIHDMQAYLNYKYMLYIILINMRITKCMTIYTTNIRSRGVEKMRTDTRYLNNQTKIIWMFRTH